MSDDYDWKRGIERRIEALEAHEHGPGYHDHLLEHEEFEHHHSKAHEPKDKRAGERRGEERRKSTEKYEGEERRA